MPIYSMEGGWTFNIKVNLKKSSEWRMGGNDMISIFLITWNKHTNDDFNKDKNKSLFLMKITVFFHVK